MNWYVEVFKKYAVFEGRARRKEYWMFLLFNAIIMGVLEVLLIATQGSPFAIALFVLYVLAIFIPTLAVTIRRLHDIGKSGWYIFMGLIPVVGVILLLVYYCTESEPGENKYGACPK